MPKQQQQNKTKQNRLRTWWQRWCHLDFSAIWQQISQWRRIASNTLFFRNVQNYIAEILYIIIPSSNLPVQIVFDSLFWQDPTQKACSTRRLYDLVGHLHPLARLRVWLRAQVRAKKLIRGTVKCHLGGWERLICSTTRLTGIRNMPTRSPTLQMSLSVELIKSFVFSSNQG